MTDAIKQLVRPGRADRVLMALTKSGLPLRRVFRSIGNCFQIQPSRILAADQNGECVVEAERLTNPEIELLTVLLLNLIVDSLWIADRFDQLPAILTAHFHAGILPVRRAQEVGREFSRLMLGKSEFGGKVPVVVYYSGDPGYFTLTTTNVVIEFWKRSGLLPPRAYPLSPGTIGRFARFRPLRNGRSPGIPRNPPTKLLFSCPWWRGRTFVPEVIRELVSRESTARARLLR